MELYKLDNKLERVKLDAARVQQLRALGYIRREALCGGAENYYAPLNPHVPVACRVHGVGTCPHDQALGPDRRPEQFPALTRIALTDDDAAIEARYVKALEQLEPKLVELRTAVQAQSDAPQLGREIVGIRRAQAVGAARVAAQDAYDAARALSPEEKAALLQGKTNAADAANFGQRRFQAMKWMREPSRVGKMSKELFTRIERVENDYHVNPMQAARTLDKSIQRLGEIEKLEPDEAAL